MNGNNGSGNNGIQEARRSWSSLTAVAQTVDVQASVEEPLIEVAQQLRDELLKTTDLDSLMKLKTSAQRTEIESNLDDIIQRRGLKLTQSQRAMVVTYILNEAFGYGPLARLISDTSITEIMVNGPQSIFVERKGQVARESAVKFQNEDHVMNVVDRIVSRIGRRVDESSPMVDARLNDGSRVNVIIPPLSLNGPVLTIRKFTRKPLSLEDLGAFGTLTDDMADFLRAAVQARLSVLVSGGTGTGKTTLLNALAGFINPRERIITVEDSAELKFHETHPHVIRCEARPPNLEGKGAVTIRDLVRNSLRMRPDRIIVGEIRGGEALDMLQAMNTGHEGSMTTVHANSPEDSLRRLETMVMWAEDARGLPISAIREQIASAIDIVLQITRFPNGRKVTAISEVQEIRHGEIVIRDIFRYDVLSTNRATGDVDGRFNATGVIPVALPRMEALGQTELRSLFVSSYLEDEVGQILQDTETTEVMINGLDEAFIERRGQMHRVSIPFRNEYHLLGVINSIIAPLGRRLDARHPMVDARLPDGSRVNAAIPPVSLTGPILTIRRFPDVPLQIDDLLRFGSITRDMADFIMACVRSRLNVLVSGGTGSGKTTLLNILSGAIPSSERIITIEDVAELRLQKDHWIRMEVRHADEFGEGQVTVRDLVVNALRMRPDRIIVGEVRGAEALDMLQAMNTGHEGSMTTVHANSPYDAFARLETMVMFASTNLSSQGVRDQMAGALDVIIQQSRTVDGKRKIVAISEVADDRKNLHVNDIFTYTPDKDGNMTHRATGYIPTFLPRLAARGYKFEDDFFQPPVE